MSYIFGQTKIVTATGVQPLFTLPAGLCNFTFWNGTTGTLYIGTSTAVTSTNGMLCATLPSNPFQYPGSRGPTVFYGTVSSGTAICNYVINTAF